LVMAIGVSAAAGDMVWSGWSGGEESTKPMIQEMIDTWNEENPDTRFQWIGWPWSETLNQLIIKSQGGQNLDVAQIDMSWLSALAETGKLVDLNTVFSNSYLKDNFQDSYLKIGQVEGKQLGLPWSLASIGMVYNPTLLNEAGVKGLPTTIAEFEATLKALKDYNSEIIPYAMVTKDPGSMISDFQAWLWTFGGEVFDEKGNVVINNEAGIKTLEWYKKLMDKDYIKMDMSRFDARPLFAQGTVGFYDDAVMANGIFKSNSGKEEISSYIQPILRPVLNKGDNPQSKMWGHLLVMFETSRDKEKAGGFLQHVTGKEMSLKYFEHSAMLPVTNNAINSSGVQNNDWANKWLKITQYGKRGEIAVYKNASQINDIIASEIQYALMGDKTAKKALDDAAKRIELAIR
jgi:multiple sugar transport system substrate-binding protein